jgi:hypothetical protein
MNYIIVRNPQLRLLPGFVRVMLGEEYLTVETFPQFTNEFARARVFPSFQWADSYLHDRDGNLRPYASGCVIRSTSAPHTIPVRGESESS